MRNKTWCNREHARSCSPCSMTCKPQMKWHSCSNISAVEVYLTFGIFLDNTVIIFLFMSMAFIQYSGVIFIGGPLNFQNSFEVRTTLSGACQKGGCVSPRSSPFRRLNPSCSVKVRTARNIHKADLFLFPTTHSHAHTNPHVPFQQPHSPALCFLPYL